MSKIPASKRQGVLELRQADPYNGIVDRVMHGVSANSPLPPSVETAYYRKCIELKRRINEIEESNDSLRVRKMRSERAILKMRLERGFLLEKIAQTMKENPDDSDQSNSPPPTVSYTIYHLPSPTPVKAMFSSICLKAARQAPPFQTRSPFQGHSSSERSCVRGCWKPRFSLCWSLTRRFPSLLARRANP